MMKMNLFKNNDDVSSKVLFYEMARAIYVIGLFIIFLMTKNYKIRIICWITMLIPSFLEFVYKKISPKLGF